MKNFMVIVVVGFAFSIAEAKIAVESCSIFVNREACPGRETEAGYPYNGVNPTTHAVQAKDQAKCVAAAQRMATIARTGVLKKVTATATFNGSILTPVVSEAACEPSSKHKKSASSSDPRLSKDVTFQGTANRK